MRIECITLYVVDCTFKDLEVGFERYIVGQLVVRRETACFDPI
jgi:hypothetical protein